MLSSDAVEAYIKLSVKISSIEEPSLFMVNLLPGIAQTFQTLNFDYECVNFVLLKDATRISYFYDKELGLDRILNFPFIESSVFLQTSEVEKELLWGKHVISSSIENLVTPSYQRKDQLRTILMYPIFGSKGLFGCLVMATKRGANEITPDEQELGKLITQLANFTYKIGEGEVSLTQVTQEVYKMNSELHRINKLKDDFVSIASHELRTPMTAIRSYAWMALNKSDIPLSDKLKKYLQRTLISTERLISLVNDMLNVSRIESGRIEIAPESFNLQNLVGEVLIEIDAKAKEKNLRFVHNTTPLPNIFADSNKVHQVLLNLLGNSLKFTPHSGVVTISYFNDGKQVQVDIADNGSGISAEDLSRLFKKFSRLDNSYIAASSSGGTGLGLYICKSLIDLMKGKIWVKSDGVGKGATFSFSLPIATDELIRVGEKYHYKPTGEARLLEPVAIQAFPNEPA